ncbi:MAG: vitamin K epoxide reductase family protein [Gemmatimonadaceae bacterium]
MERRRKVVGLSLVAAAAMGLIAAYQTGIIKHLPEPPLPLLDADKVDASSEAYAKLSVPDGILGLGSYAVTMGLAAMGGSNRAKKAPWIPLALAAKVAADSVNAGKLTVDQWTKHRAFCSYCLLSAAVTFAMVPLVLPEARTALRQITA